MAHQYTRDGRLWQPGHPAWPNKADGTPYQQIPAKKKQKLEDAGEWPNLFLSVTTYLKYCKGEALLGWKEWQIKTLAKAVYNEKPDNFPNALAARIAQEKNAASDRGTELHDVLATHLAKNTTPDPDFNPVEFNMVTSVRAWMVLQGLDPLIAVYEWGFTCDDMFEDVEFGGTLDAIFRKPDRIIMVDFKTTTGVKKGLPYPDQAAQVSAYIRAWHLNHGTFQINEPMPGTKDEGYNLYINQEDGRLYAVAKYDTFEVLQAAYMLFIECYRLDKAIKNVASMTKVEDVNY